VTTPVVVIGAGGFGRETLDVIEAMNAAAPSPRLEIIGVVDDHPAAVNLARLKVRDVRYLGSTDDWISSGGPGRYVIGVGNTSAREAIAKKLDVAGKRAVTVVHPSATIGPRSTMAAGCVVCAGVRITNNVSIGRHAHLNLNVTVGHDCVIGDFVSINPLVAVSGDCILQDQVTMGTGSVVLQGITIEMGATAGASACVVRNVIAGAIVKGVPAR
jgi:sugar O-acyltransferase (sialic acid O-acetyltransferase NeuD family)